MAQDTDFLSGLMERLWSWVGKHGLHPSGLYLGNGNHAIEVAVARFSGKPALGALLDVWKGRRDGRASLVMLVVLNVDGADHCGPSGEEPPV